MRELPSRPSDDELIRRSYLLVRQFDDLDPDDLYWQFDELFERYAPGLVLPDRERALREDGESDEEVIARELKATERRIDARAAARARARVQATREAMDPEDRQRKLDEYVVLEGLSLLVGNLAGLGPHRLLDELFGDVNVQDASLRLNAELRDELWAEDEVSSTGWLLPPISCETWGITSRALRARR